MPTTVKPCALRPGDSIRLIAPASPVREDRLRKGCEEITRLGYVPLFERTHVLARDGFFAGPMDDRLSALTDAFSEPDSKAVVCVRGGYGSNYLLEHLHGFSSVHPKIFLGFSDITSLQIYLWQKRGWVTFSAPMVAAGFDMGPGQPGGYDKASFDLAVSQTRSGWTVPLEGETLRPGSAEGIVIGGCLTMMVATLGTPWEIDTRGAILLLEDRAMKPFQVDRALKHLEHAGKFRELRGMILGEFPECVPPAGTETVRDVAARLAPAVPVAWNVPFGHTTRPMLTIPMGISARLSTTGTPELQFLEPACVDAVPAAAEGLR
jgi:muramoyltetrapeptide carboxypeptidase